MALTRNIPLKNYRFTELTLSELLTELAACYTKTKDEYSPSRFSFDISENEHTSVSLDSPPKSFERILNTPIHRLSLDVYNYKPQRSVKMCLYHGRDSIYNEITLRADDEKWVNDMYARIGSILNRVHPQPAFRKRLLIPIFVIFSFIFGWFSMKIIDHLFSLFAEVKYVPWTLERFLYKGINSTMFGTLPALILYLYVLSSFPSIEIQTGPKHLWVEHRRRRFLARISGVVLLAPLGALVYDIYKLVTSS